MPTKKTKPAAGNDAGRTAQKTPESVEAAEAAEAAESTGKKGYHPSGPRSRPDVVRRHSPYLRDEDGNYQPAMRSVVRFRCSADLLEFCKGAGSMYIRRILQPYAELVMNQKNYPGRKEANELLSPQLIEPAIESIERWEALASCGFPSPALDYAQDSLNLNDYFLNHPSATFAITARGDSMIDYGIYDGDILFVDRAAEARTGDIVLAFVDGNYTVKEIDLTDKVPKLHPYNANENYPVIIPQDLENFWIEGVVVSLGRRFHRRPRTLRRSRFSE